MELRLGKKEIAVIKSSLPGRFFSAGGIYWVVASFYPKIGTRQSLHNTLKALTSKGLMSRVKDKHGLPLYTLTPYGETFRNYLLPFPVKISQLKYTTILVTPETAAAELALKTSTVRKRKAKYLHYLTINKRLYILKREKKEKLEGKVPDLPFVKDFVELESLWPDLSISAGQLISNLQHDGRWVWPEVLEMLLCVGSYKCPPSCQWPFILTPFRPIKLTHLRLKIYIL